MTSDPGLSTGDATIHEAAGLLNVSHAFVLGLLAAGTLPSLERDGQRRIPRPELDAYLAREKERQRVAMRELQAEAQRLGIGY